MDRVSERVESLCVVDRVGERVERCAVEVERHADVVVRREKREVWLVNGERPVLGRLDVEAVTDLGGHRHAAIANANPWLVTETHLHVADTEDGIPQNRKGNPIPGQFDYSTTHDPATGEVVIDDIAIPDDTDEDGDVTIAVHAVVVDCGTDFEEFSAGDSIEAAGAVHPNLTIDGVNGTAQYVVGDTPGMYGAPNGVSDNVNGCLDVDGGFGDPVAKDDGDAQDFDFTFADPVSEFSLRMLDFGDFNPDRDTHTKVELAAYDADDNEVDSHVLEYYTNGGVNPSTAWADAAKTTVLWDDLFEQGDACDAVPGEPGNWTWHVSSPTDDFEIVRAELRFVSGHDPNIVFDTLCVRDGTETDETAWADGKDGHRFTERGNWATYFEFVLPDE